MKKIRISIILENYKHKPFWINKILKSLKDEFYIENYLIYVDKSLQQKKLINSFFFKLLILIEKIFFYKKIKKYNQREFILDKKKKLILKTVTKKKFFIPIKLSKLRKVDCIINLSDKLIIGNIFKKSKHGIWGLHHSDNCFQRGGYGGFYEILEKKKESGITLQKYNNKMDNGLVVDKIFFKTKKTYLLNHYNLLNNSAKFLVDNLKKIQNKRLQYKRVNLKNSKLKSYPKKKDLSLYALILIKQILQLS